MKFAKPGFHWIIPFIDKIYIVNITEQMVDAQPQEIITNDNLNASVDAQVYFRVIETEENVKSSQYNVNNYKLQIVNLARTTLRNIIGTLTLRSANSERGKINAELHGTPSAQKVAETGHKLAKAMNAKTFLLHVISEAPYYSSLNYSTIMGFEGFINAVEPNSTEELKRVAENYLDKSKQHLKDETIQIIVGNGVFPEVILNTAKELNVDIIV
ncbi:MAG: SPFH domain-containing protein, partial [Chitinophagaceae bacterium]